MEKPSAVRDIMAAATVSPDLPFGSGRPGKPEPFGRGRESSGVGSFEETFQADSRSLYSYVSRRVGESAAEEIVAETFATAFRRWEDVDPSRPTRPWIYGIAANLIRHHWRKERRMLRAYARSAVDEGLEEQDVSTIERLDSEAQRRALADALADLRPGEREILLLHAWAELSDGEIAEALSLPLGTVKSRLHRAREHLRNRQALNGQVQMSTHGTPAEETQR